MLESKHRNSLFIASLGQINDSISVYKGGLICEHPGISTILDITYFVDLVSLCVVDDRASSAEDSNLCRAQRYHGYVGSLGK